MRWADAATASAAASGYAARSALKLLSLTSSHPQLLPRGASVLDLGCSPGAFLQVATEKVGSKGVVFGIDLVAVDATELKRQRSPFTSASPSPSSSSSSAPLFTSVADVFDLTPQTLSALFREAVEREEQKNTSKAKTTASTCAPPLLFDAVLSDLCHSTLGVRTADAARSLELAMAAARLALGGERGQGEFNRFSDPSGVLARGGSFLVKVLEGGETPALASALKPCFHSVKWARPPATRSRSTEVYLLGLGRK